MEIEKKIGFDKIRQKLYSYALSELGKSKIKDIEFSTNKKNLEEELDAVVEFVNIIETKNFPTDYFYDLRQYIQKAYSIDNSYLSAEEILFLWRSLLTIKDILNFFKNEDNKVDFPVLASKASNVKFFQYIIERIKNILTKEGQIKDSASKELKNIRNEISSKERQISSIVKKTFSEAQNSGILDEEATITVRNGKMLIPLKSGFKNKIQGIVQDYSSSGKTVYIEPLRSVELNNELRELYFSEKREIIRILSKFTSELKPYVEDLLVSYEFLAEIDFIRAKAILAKNLNATKPEITDTNQISIRQAYNPLLLWTHKLLNKKVVPLSIDLTEDKKIVLISGPNAGGKSIAIKTVGLMQYMLQCGLLVPVKETSKFGVFDEIFIDIGDEQSIENDLSTYSSHLLNMKNILEQANEKTLVLIDEFGSGTDPAMGGAIAEAILEELLNKKIPAIINTHYSNLKHFAAQSQGIVNAAMLFDKKNLKPLYILKLGQPGSSFALEIAQNIGLPEKIIEKAKSKIGENAINFDKIISEMEYQARQIQNDRKQIAQLKKELKQKVLEYRNEKEKLIVQRKKIIEQTHKESTELIENANKLIEKTIREIKANKAEKETTKKIRENFKQKKQEIINKIKTEKQEIEKIEKEIAQKKKIKEKQNISVINIGDIVVHKNKGLKGQVEEIKDGMAMIIVGNLRTFVKITDLKKIGEKNKKKENIKINISIDKNEEANFIFGIDVRGKRTDEALQKITKYIDNAIIADAKKIKILHGTGDGILRKMIRQYLRTVEEVEWFGDEDIRFGGQGITVVKLK
jgi:DNA mismatch repair protein MutS2